MANNNKKTAISRESVIKLLLLIFTIVIIFGFYRYALTTSFFMPVMIVYLVALTVLIFTYLIYNRGIPKKNITPDALPEHWSAEKKTAYIEDSARRMKRSSWMIIFIFAFIFTFAFDMFELYAIPFIESMISK